MSIIGRRAKGWLLTKANSTEEISGEVVWLPAGLTRLDPIKADDGSFEYAEAEALRWATIAGLRKAGT